MAWPRALQELSAFSNVAIFLQNYYRRGIYHCSELDELANILKPSFATRICSQTSWEYGTRTLETVHPVHRPQKNSP